MRHFFVRLSLGSYIFVQILSLSFSLSVSFMVFNSARCSIRFGFLSPFYGKKRHQNLFTDFFLEDLLTSDHRLSQLCSCMSFTLSHPDMPRNPELIILSSAIVSGVIIGNLFFDSPGVVSPGAADNKPGFFESLLYKPIYILL